MTTSNPNCRLRVYLECGCARNLFIKYQDERPEIGAGEKCDLHGDTEIVSYDLVGA